MERETKRCPYCGEEILASAKKCRHCGEWLVDDMRKETTPAPRIEPVTTGNKSQNDDDDDESWGALIGLWLFGLVRSYWFVIVLLVIAAIFVPNEESHIKSIEDDVVDCVKDQADDWLDILSGSQLGGLASLFIGSDTGRSGILESFHRENKIVVHKYWFCSTAELVNRLHPDGTNVSFGMFGFVIPYVEWDDFALVDNNDSSSTPSKNTSGTAKSKPSGRSHDNPQTVSSMQEYTGNIAGIKCHFRLRFDKSDDYGLHEVTGTYYYDKKGPDHKIILRGNYYEDTDMLSLTEYFDDGTPNAVIQAERTDDDFFGTFQNPDGKELSITMTRSY